MRRWHCKLCLEENNLTKANFSLYTALKKTLESDDIEKVASLKAEIITNNQRLREISDQHNKQDSLLMIN